MFTLRTTAGGRFMGLMPAAYRKLMYDILGLLAFYLLGFMAWRLGLLAPVWAIAQRWGVWMAPYLQAARDWLMPYVLILHDWEMWAWGFVEPYWTPLHAWEVQYPTFMTAMAGLVVGLTVSIPIGSIAAQAATRWIDGEREATFGYAAGVYIGDLLVSNVVMVLLCHRVVELSAPYLIGGIACMFVVGFVFMRHVKLIEDLRGPFQLFAVMGFVLTLVQPGNYGTYLIMYGGPVQLAMGTREVVDMDLGSIILMVTMNAIGLLIGWVGYFWLIDRLKHQLGHRIKPLLSRLTQTLALIAAIIVLVHSTV